MSTLTDDTLSLLQQAATEARGLAIDAIDACSSGHLGLPLGCAEMGAALFGNHLLNYDPASPKWLNRDRFILSGGMAPCLFILGSILRVTSSPWSK